MRILKILPGAGGGFLSESGLRDQSLVAELRWSGNDVLLVPLFLPIPGGSAIERGAMPLFYGAVRIYLEHRFPFVRRLPKKLRLALDSRRFIRLASRASISDRVRAELFVSMLRGRQGAQAEDLAKLCAWLQNQPQPDVIHISGALLLGLARQLGQVLEAPVVCSLQEELSWIESLPIPLEKRLWAEIRSCVPDVAGFIATSHFAASSMPRRMGMSQRSLRVIHPGVELPPEPVAPDLSRPLVWGVLAPPDDEASPSLALKAFALLKSESDFANFRMRLSGILQNAEVLREIAERGLAESIEFVPPGSRRTLLPNFLDGLSVFTLFTEVESAFPRELLQAMAHGVAVAQPNSGCNPEILELAEGGELFEPGMAESLADILRDILRDVNKVRTLARRGRRGVSFQFSPERMARETLEVYQAVREGRHLTELRKEDY